MKPFALSSALLLLAGPGTLLQDEAAPGGGTLQLGKDAYAFRFESLNLAPAQPKLKLSRAFVLRGKLVSEAHPSLAFELTALEDGRIYGLRVYRKTPGGEDRWGALLKTKVEVLELDARPGGKLRLALSGPLTSVEGNKIAPSTWKGEIWGTFREVPL